MLRGGCRSVSRPSPRANTIALGRNFSSRTAVASSAWAQPFGLLCDRPGGAAPLRTPGAPAKPRRGARVEGSARPRPSRDRRERAPSDRGGRAG
ncbi:uncharacterized protein SOCE26_083190 [Sorangium cellulosum]|uniref:Uncharacterized protein n=1 Tax=Sorangium cellulosum TaxID=56 RepID=A0A2L0F5H2_SORCE|nr:uncharacterized protein SOCE26_083190 [Sorangium cellulosum]